jgi:hypothetical protein
MSKYIDGERLQNHVALYMAENAYINDSALDILKMVSKWIDEAPTVNAEQVVHCEHCTIKKAVPHKDGIVWRCPHRTGDVKMEGYCESGVRADGS